MAKIYGLFGSMTGKLADTVMSVRNGEQLARKYQPIVFNPSTPAQVAQRAKMKLMSQLSAVLGNVIAIPRIGNVSSRNLFTKRNFPLATYTAGSGEASIDLNSVQLTDSVVGLPLVSASRRESDAGLIEVSLASGVNDIDKVVYVALLKGADNSLRFGNSIVVSTPGTPATFEGGIDTGSYEECVILAYGVRANTDGAKSVFGNMQATTAEQIAKLIVTRSLNVSDVTLTETKGATVTAAQ